MNDILNTALAGLANRLGRFETSLLVEIESAGDDAYCAELSRRLSLTQKRNVSMGQVSRSLGTLKRMGLLASEQRWPPTPQKHQRHRLVFSLTMSGVIAIKALKSKKGNAAHREVAEPAYAV